MDCRRQLFLAHGRASAGRWQASGGFSKAMVHDVLLMPPSYTLRHHVPRYPDDTRSLGKPTVTRLQECFVALGTARQVTT